jgi:hypothetical protein
MIKDVIIKVEVFVLLLGIGSLEIILPGNLGCVFGVKVDPDEAIVVNVCVNTEQPVLGLVETLKLLVARSLCEVPAETIRPAVVSVCKLVSIWRLQSFRRLSLAHVCLSITDLQENIMEVPCSFSTIG